MKKILTDFGQAIKHGDLFTGLSLLIMGMGYWGRGQIVKGLIVTLTEAGFFLFTGKVSLQYISKLGTLGTVQREEVLDLVTLTKKVNDFDNSLQILLFGIVGILIIVAFIAYYISNMVSVYELQKLKNEGKHINSFKEDLGELLNEKFHITLLTLPALGVILINVIPIIFMICIAFTNYDRDHQPPTYLFTWVGVENFISLFTSTATSTFGYVFVRVLAWTLVWAPIATFTTYFGGIMLAKLINDRQVRFKKMWRTFFVITIAIPQFVTLLLIGKMFSDYGIINSICLKIGLVDFLQKIGLISEGMRYIPFLSKPGWAHIMIILINLWVGIPFQMLSATGILLNIPADQLESARIDGASERQIFAKIIMPYIFFITGPSLVTSLISNINNFNVIYLLTSDYITPSLKFANSSSKEVDLLVTWLFTLTNSDSNYKMASVIGIIVFLICALGTLLSFSRLLKDNREEDFQ
ncbi:MAG: sugar ABC transporter permease [Pseudobutyrivibrio sp.]|nr:sugar ABC transporter permease [Pseudobutyrivibrio sp.]